MPNTKPDASLADAATSAMKMGMKMGEIAVASGLVIGARMMLMGAALRDPMSGDYREFGRMVPEKLFALAQSGVALMEQVGAAQREAVAQMATPTGFLTGLHTPAGLMQLASEAGERGARAMMWPLAASDATLAPVYRTVTANARRLRPGSRGRR